MSWLMNATTVLTGLSTIFLIALLVIYAKNLKGAKSKLLIGLIIFVGLFLIQNIVSLYYVITMMAYYVSDVEVHVFALTVLQTIAFAVMLWISWE